VGLLSVGLLGGCDQGTTAPVTAPADGELPPLKPGELPPCVPYQDMGEDIYGYCVYRFAVGFPTIEEMERMCAEAGPWEERCRHAWVAGDRMALGSEFSKEDLLGACGTNIDCTFELLDARPEADALIQLELCRRHTGQHSPDCAGHAMQRWFEGGPDAAEIARVLEAPTAFPHKVGYYAGAAVACFGVGECAGPEAVQKRCAVGVEKFQREPQQCRHVGKLPMHQSMNPAPPRRNSAPGGTRGPPRPTGRPPASGRP